MLSSMRMSGRLFCAKSGSDFASKNDDRLNSRRKRFIDPAAVMDFQPRAARARFADLWLAFRKRLVGCSALLDSPPVFRTALVVLRTPRSASLTAASVGKASATSASSTTTLVPSRTRETYFPRTPLFIEEKSYSDRRSSPRRGLVFFIKCSLSPRGRTRADDAHLTVNLRMRHYQEAASSRGPDD